MAGRQRRRRWPGLLIGVLVLAALLWGAYWYLAQLAATRAITRLNAGPVSGRQIGCDTPAIGGSFLKLDIRCQRLTYAENSDRIVAEVGGVAASAPLYWPGSVSARLNAPLRANAPAFGVAMTANWSAANAIASAGLGGIRGAGAEFLSLAVDNAGTIPHLPLKAATADRARASFESAGGGAYTLLASATALKLVKNDGTEYPAIDASTRVVAEGVGDLGTDPATAVRAWLKRGGSAVIERFRFSAAGAVISGNGKLTLAPTGLLSGSILLRYNSIEALGNLVETLKPGAREKLSLALQGLNAMSAPTKDEDGSDMRQTTITLTDGLAWVAVVPLGVVPAIRF